MRLHTLALLALLAPAPLASQTGDAQPLPQDAMPSANVPPPSPLDPTPGGDVSDAEQEEMTESEDVEDSQPPEPNRQGTRDPMATPGDDMEPGLYQLLSAVRSAPPGLDGQPIPRPNEFASEPAKEMEPIQPEDLYLFPENYVE